MSHVYISYSREDRNFVDLIEDDLIERDHPAWRDTSSIGEGTEWDDAIREAIDHAYALIVVLSERALRSEWVQREIEQAEENNIPTIVAQFDTCEMPASLGDAPCINFAQIRDTEGLDQLRQYRQALNDLIHELDETRPQLLYLRQLDDPHHEVREQAAHELGKIGDPTAARALIQILDDPDADVRFAAAEALGELRSEEAMKPLMRRLDDEDPDVCAAAAVALGKIGLTDPIGTLIDKLDNQDRFVRAGAAQALGDLDAAAAVPQLINLMRNDSIGDVRRAAAAALCQIGGREAKRALRRAGIDCEGIFADLSWRL